MKYSKKTLILLLVSVAIAIAFGWQWWQKQQNLLPDNIASGNGRIEANEVDIASKFAGRVQKVFVEEGDLVSTGQKLVQLDTTELRARLDKARAELGQGIEAKEEARVHLQRARTDLAYQQQQLERAEALLGRNLVSQSAVDERRNARDLSAAEVRSAEAHLRTLDKCIESYQASVRQIEADIEEATLYSPVEGRVLYQLTRTGEMTSTGGKVLTVLDLSSVYMEVFLPASAAGVLAIGSEARIVLDIAPDLPLPATVTFVSPQAQFTPKQVETRSERDKLVFRVKLQLPTQLVLENIDRVKTGLRGVGYVRADAATPWPDFLEGTLTGQDE